MSKKLSLEDVSLLLEEDHEDFQRDYEYQKLLHRQEVRSIKKNRSLPQDKPAKRTSEIRNKEWT
jgi:hypothetical protein